MILTRVFSKAVREGWAWVGQVLSPASWYQLGYAVAKRNPLSIRPFIHA